MMNLQKTMLLLQKENIETSIKLDDSGEMYLDLQTMAKSHLYLYESGRLIGRYDYETFVDFSDINSLLSCLCVEFNHALHGRGYFQDSWGKLCERKQIALEIFFN